MKFGRAIVFIGGAVFLIIGFLSYLSSYQEIKRSTKETLSFRVDSFNQYLHMMAVNNLSMHDSMQSHYQLAKKGYLYSEVVEGITFFPQQNVYGLSAFDSPQYASQLLGTLTALADVDISAPHIQHEMTAVITLDEQLAAYVGDAELAIWTYYLSQHRFLYLLPKLRVRDFQITPSLYEKPFWTQVIPEVNPARKQIITPLYEDAGGEGLMVTIASPVYSDDTFLGVICVDVGIAYMRSVLTIGDAVGESVLVDEEGLLAAKAEEIHVGQVFQTTTLDSKQQWQEYADRWVYATPIEEGQLFFVHELSKSELMTSSIKASLTTWLFLIIGYLLGGFAYYMYRVSIKHKKLMRLDPLTRLYNRRGFKNIVSPIYDSLIDSEETGAFLLLDIDKFKAVNDNYGHSVGDEVIRSMAEIISSMDREGAVCSRWGGEEFLVFIPNISLNDAFNLAESIRARVETTRHSQHQLAITISIGLSISCGNKLPEWVINQADEALYRAKKNGRNRTEVFLPT
ncbi:sensor domain-containing diguanylate cyclase [Thaumasiovibrio subtropicus]|uniref:sensor domain-containing diguanylate cyclase n=1 Tax=Thaumasiovibrio subtropicus TaxID=1891207 RepID=UPI000B3588AF|nr:sensor domain-containing diguanylate cyclase [Thaumasiovibrio subtropicus]